MINLNFSAVVFAIDTLILALFVYRIRIVLKKENIDPRLPENQLSTDSRLAKYFYGTILILMSSFFVFACDLFFFYSDMYYFIFYKIIGDGLLFASFAYGVNIPLSLKFPQINKRLVVIVLLIFSFLLDIYQVFNPPRPEIIKGVIFWNLDLSVSLSMYIFGLIAWLPTGILFLNEGIKNKKHFIKHLLLGLSFIIISLTGPLMLVTKSIALVIMSQIAMTVGYLLLFFGMFYRKSSHKND